ncbi:MAG: hypothetical protein SFZ02_15095 [bacterium]|nr:hypothetical protein [bacterium]
MPIHVLNIMHQPRKGAIYCALTYIPSQRDETPKRLFRVLYALLLGVIWLSFAITIHAQTDEAILSPENIDDVVQIGTLTGFADGVSNLVFTANGQFIIAGGEDTSLRVWDVTTQTQTQELFPHNTYIKDVALSPDGTLLATASWDRQVLLYTVAEDGFLIQTDSRTGYMSVIDQIAFLADGESVIFGVGDASLVVANVSNPSEQVNLPINSLRITALDSLASATINLVAVGTGFPDESLMVFLADNFASAQTVIKPHAGGITAIAFSPIIGDDVAQLVTVGDDATIRLWQVTLADEVNLSQTPFAVIESPEAVWYTAIAYSPDGNLLFATTIEGQIIVWDMTTPTTPVQVRLFETDSAIRSIAISRDGHRFATGHDDGVIMIWGID